jgi:hypothetical protein
VKKGKGKGKGKGKEEGMGGLETQFLLLTLPPRASGSCRARLAVRGGEERREERKEERREER